MFRASNIQQMTVFAIAVIGGISWDALMPGDVVTFTGTYIVTQADVVSL